MTPKEYLKQAYRLDITINSRLKELEDLKCLVYSLPTSQYGDRVQTTKNNEAPFVRQLEKVWRLENTITAEIDKFIDLKAEMRQAIDELENTDECLVLRKRYIHGKTWEKIAEELVADRSTVLRWHAKALKCFKVPENPIII
jgi:DNA-directed RNA polymerase sigma subunit (sigma70/sigma32)